jgi:Calcineurin-like phosphoesterase
MTVSRAAAFPTAALLVAVLVTACAREPLFRESLPTAIDTQGKVIAVIGDLQQTSGFVRFVRHREETSAQQRRLMADLDARIDELGALIVVGDLVYSARSAKDWAHFDSLVAPFVGAMPILPAIGNHDYPCFLIQFCRISKTSKGMLERFPWFSPGMPYAVDDGDLRLLFLDSETGLQSQGRWLEAELAAARGRYAAALVFFHRPAYTNSIDWGSDPNPDILDNIVPRLEAADLPVVVFNGHIHGFEHIVRDGVPYVTTAGGGGPRNAMSTEHPFDQYRGPDCPDDMPGRMLRPFNYVLLRQEPGRLVIDVRGFCRDDAEIRLLDTIEVPL